MNFWQKTKKTVGNSNFWWLISVTTLAVSAFIAVFKKPKAEEQ